MPKTLPLTLLALLAASPALADPNWDHSALASHYEAVDRVERPLAAGERRVGRIIIGTAATDSDTSVPETIETATQRQWIQRGSFSGGGPGSSQTRSPRIQAGRYDGTPGRGR